MEQTLPSEIEVRQDTVVKDDTDGETAVHVWHISCANNVQRATYNPVRVFSAGPAAGFLVGLSRRGLGIV
jgi:hypothetical protein